MNIVDCNTRTTLLLNNAWQPITAITAKAAFAHLLSQNVTALDKNNNLFDSIEKWNDYAEFHEDQPVLRSAKRSWPIPTIIIVTSKFFKKPKKKKLSLAEQYLMAEKAELQKSWSLPKESSLPRTLRYQHSW